MPTIGVAIAIPEPWANDLQDYRTSVGDTTATQIPTHITLVPPTEVPGPDLDAVCAHLARAASAVPPFDIHLRGTTVLFATHDRALLDAVGCDRVVEVRDGEVV